VLDAVLLRPLPYSDPERLVFIWEGRREVARNTVAGHEFPAWQQQSRSFSSMGAMAFDRDFSLTGAGDPLALNGVRVISEFFRVLGTRPVVGEVFGPDADEPGNGDQVVVSHRLWRERFHADPAIVGRMIELNDRPHSVRAVMPQEFDFPANAVGAPPDVWTPIAEPIQRYVGRHYLFVIGRLAPSVTREQAQSELAGISDGIARELPANQHHTANVQPLASEIVTNVRTALLVLFSAVAAVLLVACCNVVNLLLARAVGRQHEIAVRTALGAGAWRIARQLLVEGAALACSGAFAGLLLAQWLVSLARTTAPGHVPRLSTVSIDARVLAFTAGLAGVVTLAFGLAPLLRFSRLQIAKRLSSGAKGVPRASGSRLRNALIVAEVALTLMLSIGAALLLQSFLRMNRIEPGFETGNVVAVDLSLPSSRYGTAQRQRAFYSDTIDSVRAIPGVVRVAATNMVPQGGGISGLAIAVEGRPASVPGQEPMARYRIVSTDYFSSLGIAVREGRTFQPTDARVAVPLIRWFRQQPLPSGSDAPQPAPVAVINERMAREIWQAENALGRRFRVLFSPPITVVGIVADTRNTALADEPVAEFYLSDLQEPQSRMTLLVRTSGDTPVVPAVRSRIAQLDPKLPIAAVRTLDEIVDGNLLIHRFLSTLMGGFAITSLLLMVAGVYCVIAYATAQRRHEIGIRMALGATRVDVGRLIVSGALVLCGIGAALGTAGGYALARSSSALLFDVGPGDPFTYGGLILVVLLVALAASWIPARRAMRVDPASVLRCD
jgi:putative ABC transport system permease protein